MCFGTVKDNSHFISINLFYAPEVVSSCVCISMWMFTDLYLGVTADLLCLLCLLVLLLLLCFCSLPVDVFVSLLVCFLF